MNPVDHAAFTRPLIKALRGHVDALTKSIPHAPGEQASDDSRRRVAVVWAYATVLTAWAEDHGLTDAHLRADAEPQRKEYLADGGDIRGWLGYGYAPLAIHPATGCLLDRRYIPELYGPAPSAQACQDLVDWWAGDAPTLAYESDEGPASITGWLAGDLLQALSDERVKGNAFCQTPWWIADLIIDRTLVPAAAEFAGETLMTIDPCCGTGHFLIRKIDYLWEWYTTGRLAPRQARGGQVASGGNPLAPAEAIRRILAGVTGVELDPLTAAVARLRFVVTVGALMRDAGLLDRPLRLDTIPADLRPRIAVGDSLLGGKVSATEYAQLRPEQAAIVNLGIPDQPDDPGPADEPEQLDLFGAA